MRSGMRKTGIKRDWKHSKRKSRKEKRDQEKI
jgi:hypothetical protein